MLTISRNHDFGNILTYNRTAVLLHSLGNSIEIPSPYWLFRLIQQDPNVEVITGHFPDRKVIPNHAQSFKNEMTYSDCVAIRLGATKKDKIDIEVTVYDGDFVHGYPVRKRSTYYMLIHEYRSWIDNIAMQLLDIVALEEIRKEEELELMVRLASKRAAILREMDK